MPSPRVLFVNHTSTVSGAEMVLADAVQPWAGASALLFEDGPLAGILRACGLAVTTARHGGGLTGLKRNASPFRALPVFGRLAGLVREVGRAGRAHDVVYANSQKAFVLAALARGLSRRPLIWHLHDIIDPDHFGAAQRWLQVRLANRCASLVIVPSQASARAFVAAGGAADRVRVVPNGLSVPLDPRPRAELRRALGLADGPTIGVFSRLAAWKGQHVVVEALAELPGVAAVLAGDALFGESAYAERLRNLIAERGLGDRIHLLGPRRDVPLLMQAVDVVVHPSIHPEPFGRTLVEAMLVGTPVIATDTGAAAEILEGGAAGVLVPPARPAALAAAVRTLLADPQAVDGLTARATARARTCYGVDAMRAALADCIRALAGGART